MSDWKKISMDGISNIEKLVAEYLISATELNASLIGSAIKIRVYENLNGIFIARSNIRLKIAQKNDTKNFEATGDSSDNAFTSSSIVWP